MKLLSCLCVFTLSSCFWLEIYGQHSTKSIVFPKDRKQRPSGRIIGGQEVTPHSFPFQVAIFVYIRGGSNYFCGGTLISAEWVLTAAHCVDVSGIGYIQVNLGSHYAEAKFEDTRVVLNAIKVVLHPRWNPMSVQNDLALVRLPTNVTLNENISPVQFARGKNTYANRIGSMLGWGLTSALPSLSAVLRIVNSNIMTNEACNSGYFNEPITSSHICTSGRGPVGTCSGDSGGPLLVNGVQVGITSFGIADCSAEYPSVFTRVSEYEDWIVQQTDVSMQSGLDGVASFNNLHNSIAFSIVLCLYRLFTSI